MSPHSPQDSSPTLVPGQRWISETEPELGMGILVSLDKRFLTIEFPAGNCTRQYSRMSAPVRRARFKPGDRIHTLDNQEILVETVEENKGLITYFHGTQAIGEEDLAHFMELSLPQERLMAGLAGPSSLFDLRLEILNRRAGYENSRARGFLGGQVDLIPHQFFIADQVTSRYFPRVLLSDETGLGKTIEAGLILHKLLISHQIQRVLIIVPDALVHQWFIEFYRKFSLSFRIFDETHCLDSEISEPGLNPFSSDQQGICSQSFIQSSFKRKKQILEAGWDMVVMDEAHHLTDQPQFYDFMQSLGKRTKGLMLLTATPEQMGTKTHFAQLKLLDPHRYFDLDAYELETLTFEKTAKKVRAKLKSGEAVDSLLDTHGPGRVIFRNRRANIKGFPKRRACLIPLDTSEPQNLDLANDQGLANDPRIICLAQLAVKIKPEKILVICDSAEKAGAVDRAIKANISIDLARFDETMTLLTRDRNAAWFAREDGARLLICSEIGSEGRNFQFVHHLFLFDLPLNPELLEQRIGRVDRIGQKKDISIHVPFVRGSAHEVLAQWYARGLPLFEKNINGIHLIFTRFKSRLMEEISFAVEHKKLREDSLETLLTEAARHTAKTQKGLDRGKNILVELNSFKSKPAQSILREIQRIDRDPGLDNLLEPLLDLYGVDLDRVRDNTISLSMDQMADESFPALPRGAEAVTFDRATAIAREDMVFLTWDHPFVNQVLDFFITKGEGMAATARIRGADQPGLFLETIFILECFGQDPSQGTGEFIPPQPLHILVSHTGEDCTGKTLFTDLPHQLEPDIPGWFMEIEGINSQLIPDLVEKSLTLAEKKAVAIRTTARKKIEQTLGKEVARLLELKIVNPDIREEEIQAAQNHMKTMVQNISQARLRLDGVRLIRAEP